MQVPLKKEGNESKGEGRESEAVKSVILISCPPTLILDRIDSQARGPQPRLKKNT